MSEMRCGVQPRWRASPHATSLILLVVTIFRSVRSFSPQRILSVNDGKTIRKSPEGVRVGEKQYSSSLQKIRDGPHLMSQEFGLGATAGNLESQSAELNKKVEKCGSFFGSASCKVKVGLSLENKRLGLLATQDMKRGDVALSCPYDDQLQFSADLATKVVFKGEIPEDYDGWTGEVGLVAMCILNEMARLGSQGIPLPKRKPDVQDVIGAWLQSIPSPQEMATLHPLMWDETSQELLQSSSTRKIYRTLDDIDEDATWLAQNIWAKDTNKFPLTVTLPSEQVPRPCFSLAGFRWAVAIVTSRSFFVDGSLRLLPIFDFVNHDDQNDSKGAFEVSGGYMGTFGTVKCSQIRVGRDITQGEEVLVSYGPKSAADYLLEHGFVPRAAVDTRPSAELTFEIDREDRFVDDKLDILEFETYDAAPMEPTQTFDVGIGGGDFDGEPDAAMIQFLRLSKLTSHDAFLLESLFRREVWGLMEMPVSEANEKDVVDTILETCTNALNEITQPPPVSISEEDMYTDSSPSSLCALVRKAEKKALTSTIEFMQREREALDLKEYYQDRRLKSLGLDIPWNPEEEGFEDPDLGYGQARVPGGGELDW